MGKKWLFYIHVSRICSNLNNMALMRLKTAFQNFKTYSMPICVPALVEQPAAPEEHETEDPEDGNGGAEAAVLEQSLSLYLSKSIFGYETANESEDDSDGEPERKENEPDNDEGVQDMDQQNPLSKVVFEDPYIPFRMHSAHCTGIKYR